MKRGSQAKARSLPYTKPCAQQVLYIHNHFDPQLDSFTDEEVKFAGIK